MIQEKLLVQGRYTPKDLIVTLGPSTRKISPEIESKIDSLWEAKKKKAETEGKVCFNGVTYRLNSLEVKEDKLVLDFGTLEFKVRESVWQIPEYFALSEDYYHKGSYCGATVKTADNKYLVVELSGKSMNSNAYDLLGGIMEKPSEIRNAEDVFDCMFKELEEEAHISRADIKDFYLRAIILTVKTYTSFYYEVMLNATAEDILKRFTDENNDQDIKSIKVLIKEEYQGFLKNHASKSKQFIYSLVII